MWRYDDCAIDLTAASVGMAVIELQTMLEDGRFRLGVIAVAFLAANSARAETYTTFVVPDSKFTQPMSINKSGMITGNYWDDKNNQRGFFRSVDGTITRFDPKRSKETWPVGIDKDGTVVGTYQTADFSGHGFIRRLSGKIVSFDPPKSRSTGVAGIAGDIVGTYEPKSGALGFLRTKNGTYLKFKYNGYDTTPNGINDASAVVGIYWSKDGTTTHGFLRHPDGKFEKIVANGPTWPMAINSGGIIIGDDAHQGVFVRAVDGTFTTIKVSGAEDTEAVGISAKGTVVGYAHYEDGSQHGFTWTSKQGVSLIDVPAAISTTPTGINDDDVITGTSVFQDGENRSGAAFIRTP